MDTGKRTSFGVRKIVVIVLAIITIIGSVGLIVFQELSDRNEKRVRQETKERARMREAEVIGAVDANCASVEYYPLEERFFLIKKIGRPIYFEGITEDNFDMIVIALRLGGGKHKKWKFEWFEKLPFREGKMRYNWRGLPVDE